MKKKLLYITITAVIVLLQLLVVKQYIADRYYKSFKSKIQNSDLQNNKTGVSDFETRNSELKKAIHWDKNNPEIHYELARLYERQMHQAAQEEGKWGNFNGKPVFIEGEKSKYFERLTIKEYYSAISLSPSVNYYHLDLAWLLKSKLTVGQRDAKVMACFESLSCEDPVNVSNIIKEFKRTTALAPNRTYNHKVFADWLIEHILYLKNNNKTENQYKKDIKALFDEAVCEYKKAVFLKPSMLNDSLKSLVKVSWDYDKLKKILPPDNFGMKKLIFFLFNNKDWKDNEEKFTRDMESRIARYDVTTKQQETIYPFYDTLASLYKKKGETEKAIETLQNYLEIDSGHAETHFTLASLYVSAGKQEFSKRHFKMAVELDPQNASYIKKHVSMLVLWKEPIEAEAELKSLFKVNPENVFIAETLGNMYLRQKRFEEAEAVYRKITSKSTDKAQGYLLLGKLYEAEGKQEKAKTAYGKFIFYTPDKARGYFLLGKMYESQKNREKTRENYKKATLLNIRYKSHFNRMIAPDMLLEEYFKTTRDYDKLKELIPLSPDFLNKLVLFLYEKNVWNRNKSRFMADLNRTKTDFEKSNGDTNKEKRIRPWLLAYYKTLADVCVKEGDYMKAVSVLKEALKADPDNPEGHLLLAEYAFNSGTYDYTREFSQDHYEKAIALSPGNYKYEKAYALSLTEVKRFEEAESHMKKAMEKRPNDPELHEALGNIYEQTGKIDLAIDELSKAVSLSRGAEKYKKKLAQLLTVK